MAYLRSLVAAFSLILPLGQSASSFSKHPEGGLSRGWHKTVVIDSAIAYGDPRPLKPTEDRTTPPNYNLYQFLDDERLLVADGRHPFRIVSVTDGTVLRSFGQPLQPGDPSRQITFSRNGRFFLVLPDSSPTIWDAETGQSIGALPRLANARYQSAVFFNENRHLAVLRECVTDSRVERSLVTFTISQQQGVQLENQVLADINARQVWASTRHLVVTDADGANAYDPHTLQSVFQTPRADRFHVLALEDDRDVSELVALYVSHGEQPQTTIRPRLIRFSLPEGQQTLLDKFHFPEPKPGNELSQTTYSVSPDRRHLAVSRIGRLDFYDLSDGSPLQTVQTANPNRGPVLTWLAPDLLLWDGGFPDELKEYDIRTGTSTSLGFGDWGEPRVVSPKGTCVAFRHYLYACIRTHGHDLVPVEIIVLKRDPVAAHAR